MHPRAASLALSLAALTMVGCATTPPLDVAADVKLEKLEGTWHEIAKLPRLTQASCTATTITYARVGERDLDVTSRCRLVRTDGPERVVAMHAKVDDPATPAKMTLDVAGFTGAHWIVDVAPDDAWLVVGHPSRESLWILARTPALDAKTLDGILARASDARFDTSHLEWTEQAPAGGTPSSSAAPADAHEEPHTGCATSARGATTTGGASTLVALGLAFAGARRRRGRPAPRPGRRR